MTVSEGLEVRIRMTPKNLAIATLALVAFLAIVATPDWALACPNCKDSLAQNDPARLGLARGFFWSIILMLSTPFLVTAGLGTYFYVLVRNARAANVAPRVQAISTMHPA